MSDEPTTPPPSDPPPPAPPSAPPPPPDAPPPPPPSGAPPPPPPGAPPAEPQQSAGSGSGGSEDKTLMIVLAYLGPFALIPFLAEKDDQDIQWHAKHGLVLFGADIVISFLLAVVGPFTGCLSCFVAIPIWVAVAVVHIVCMVKGVSGERFRIPGLSDFADKPWG